MEVRNLEELADLTLGLGIGVGFLLVVSIGTVGLLTRLLVSELSAEWVGRGIGIAIGLSIFAALIVSYHVLKLDKLDEPKIVGNLVKFSLPYLVPFYVLILNFVSLPLLYGIDKRRARVSADRAESARIAAEMTGRDAPEKIVFRVPEEALHIVTSAGGALGAIISQLLFRHKTRKESFRTVFYFTVLLNAPAFYGLWRAHNWLIEAGS